VREVVTVALDEDWRPVRGSEEKLEVTAVCFSWGFVPSIQLSQMCGAEHHHAAELGGWVPLVSAEMETTVRGIFSAGDGAGVGGAALAVLEGRIAGIAAAARLGALSPGAARSRSRPHRAALARLRKSRDVLGRLVAARPGLAELITPDTVICPCEGTTAARVDQALDEGVVLSLVVGGHTQPAVQATEAHAVLVLDHNTNARRTRIAARRAIREQTEELQDITRMRPQFSQWTIWSPLRNACIPEDVTVTWQA